MDAQDPLWRRFFSDLGITIICWSERISWDWLRWKVDGIGSRLFSWAYGGSISEKSDFLNGLTPWRYADKELKDELRSQYEAEVALDDLERDFSHLIEECFDIVNLQHPGLEALGLCGQVLIKSHLDTASRFLREARDVVRDRKIAALNLPALPAPEIRR